MPNDQFSSDPLSDIYAPTHSIHDLLDGTSDDMTRVMQLAQEGISCTIHQLDNTVVFILDNHQEVTLRVRKIEIQSVFGEVIDFLVYCRTDFENVLVLAKKLNMRIGAFATYFTVILKAAPDFLATWNQAMHDMEHPSLFFETLDDIRRPVFLNLNHYIIARISD